MTAPQHASHHSVEDVPPVAAVIQPRERSILGTLRQLSPDLPESGAPARATFEFELPADIAERLQRVAHGASLLNQVALTTAVDVCLMRYGNGGAQVTTVPARLSDDGASWATVVGRLRPSMTFREALLGVREALLEARRQDDGSLFAAARDVSLGQLPDIAVVFQDGATPVEPPEVDVLLVVEAAGSRLRGTVRYQRQRYRPTAIARLCGHVGAVLELGLEHPEVRLRDIPLVRDAERGLIDRISTGVSLGTETAAVDVLCRRRAIEHPDRTAVVTPTGSLSYGALERHAEQLAARLRADGIAAGDRVALLLEPGIDLAAALLGVMKTGAAYVPLDRDWPADRLSFMLTHSGAKHLLVSGAPPPTLLAHPVIVIDVAAPASGDGTGAFRRRRHALEGPAYVIYTSGSTGRPKGVWVSRAALGRRVQGMVRRYDIHSHDRILQCVSPSADAFGEEIYPALVSGGTLVVHPRIARLSPLDLLAIIRREEITVLHLPVAYWVLLATTLRDQGLQVPSCVRQTIVGGEAPPPACVRSWLEQTAPNTVFVDAYGPTEATITATSHAVPTAASLAHASPRVPIGTPLPETQVHVLDDDLNLVPPGIAGEIYIGGSALASGYLADPAQSAARFLPDPFGDRPSSRMYRTGDRGRWLDDGCLEFIGRVDAQIKVLGYRIEPGEIESVLDRHPAVRQSVVTAEGTAGDTRLVAYVVPQPAQPRLERPSTASWDAAESSAGLDGLRLPDNACVFDAASGSGTFAQIVRARWPRARIFDGTADTLSQVSAQERLDRVHLVHLQIDDLSVAPLAGIDPADWARIEAMVVRLTDTDGAHGSCRDRIVCELEALGLRVSARQTELSEGSRHWVLQAVRPDADRIDATPGRLEIAPVPLTYETLVDRLRQSLPDHMIPSAFRIIDAFPLTPSGKIDRQALEGGTPLMPEASGSAARDPVEALIQQLWQEVLELERVGLHDDFFEIGGHSLRAVALAARLEQELTSNVPVRVIFERPTIAEQAAFIREQTTVALPGSLVPIRPRGTKRPLFCVHPAGGLVQVYADLGRCLDPETPIYGLQSYGLAAGELPLRRVEEIAARYLSDVRAVQPDGPYQIIGYSIGCAIAYEMAVQLEAAGEAASFVGLLDTGPETDPVTYADDAWERELARWKDTYPVTRAALELGVPHDVMWQCEPPERLRRYLAAAQQAGTVPRDVTLEQFERFLHVYGSNGLAYRAYVPKPYAGPLTLIRTPAVRGGDEALGWRATAPDVRVHTIPCDHLSMLREPHVRDVAALLDSQLAAGHSDVFATSS